uniref:Golgin subfamily A member 6-like protein 22 isoform X3 n=1 Tax=Camelus bactrianus TaxID=9837 RepID=A0A9W3FS65_CAMBA|nr:golgin subfamily A member 6-like protein 22 isoform X3 [Camelus bactrianus]
MTEEIREREKTSAEDLDEREVPIFSGMENEPPEQTVKELQQMLENQKIGFMKFVFKIIGDTREREKLLREMNEKIEWLKASVMITDEQEECCMKEGDLLCDTGETSAEWARREAAERGKEPLEQKVKLLQQKLDKEEIAFEEFRVKMTEEIRECDDLLRKVDQSIKELEASVMITDEQEECCMKKSELLCDAGKTSAGAEEWTRRVAAEKVLEGLEQKYTEFWQKLEDQERVHEGLIAIMTQEIIEREKSSAGAEEWTRRVAAEKVMECLEQKYTEFWQKLEDQERVHEGLIAIMTQEIIEREKSSAAEWARREAAERGKEPLEENIKELQQMLEDQERVSEGFRAQVPEEMKEREKTSAAEEWARRAVSVCLKREKVPLEQKVKELQRKLHKQERAFQRFRAQVTKEIIERDRLRKKMNKWIESLEALLILLKRREKCCIKKDELCCVAVKTLAAEWARREAAERGKEPLEEKIKELQQMLEDQESVSEGFRPQIPEEMKEREKTSAEDLDKKEVEREMELLKQKIKELQQMLEDQESVSEGFRPQIPEEMKEREKTSAEEPNKREEAEREEESLEQNVKGLQQKLEDRQTDVNGLKAQVTEGISKREKTSADLPGTAEWDLSEAAEGEKVDLEQKVRELQQMLEDQERAFEFYRVIITEEIQGIDDLLRKISESTELLEATINNENDRIMSKMLKMTARPR